MPLDHLKNQTAYVAENLRTRPRLIIVARLKAEQVGPLALRFVLAMLGLVVLGEVVADDAVVVGVG